MRTKGKYTLLVNNQQIDTQANDVGKRELKALILSTVIFYTVFALGVYLRVNGRLW